MLSQIYYKRLLWNVSILVIPDTEVTIAYYVGNMSAQLTLLYNTLYIVSLTQPDICGQLNQTEFIHLNYSKYFRDRDDYHVIMLFADTVGWLCHPMKALT